jgi:hypothetical protein
MSNMWYNTYSPGDNQYFRQLVISINYLMIILAPLIYAFIRLSRRLIRSIPGRFAQRANLP